MPFFFAPISVQVKDLLFSFAFRMSIYTCNVAVVGAWFAWLSAYITLKKRCPTLSIQLFDGRDKFTFIPGLHETLWATEALQRLQFSLADVYGDDFHHTKVTSVDKHCMITTAAWEERNCDYIVIATGSSTNFRDLEPFKEHAYTVRYPEDIAPLNDALLRAASTTVIGGGYTGIEVISVLASRKLGGKLRLVHNMDRFLPQYEARIGDMTQAWLKKNNVELLMNTSVKEIWSKTITLDTGEVLSSDVTIVNTGIVINDEQHAPHLSFEKTYTAQQNDHIYDCGDVAIHGLFTTAHNAYEEGKRVWNLIADRIQNIQKEYPPLTNYNKLTVALGIHDGIIIFNNKGLKLPYLTGTFKRIIEKKILREFKNKILLPV